MIKCVSTKLIVSLIKEEKQTNDLGLILPTSLEEDQVEKAKVIYVGNEVNTKIKPGSIVYIYPNSGKDFTSYEDNKKYRVITTADIIVIYE